MKKQIKLIVLSAMLIAATGLMAQTPPPPNGGSNPTSNGNKAVGGAAPIAEGFFILTALAAGYGTRKFYKSRQRLAE